LRALCPCCCCSCLSLLTRFRKHRRRGQDSQGHTGRHHDQDYNTALHLHFASLCASSLFWFPFPSFDPRSAREPATLSFHHLPPFLLLLHRSLHLVPCQCLAQPSSTTPTRPRPSPSRSSDNITKQPNRRRNQIRTALILPILPIVSPPSISP